MNSRILTRLTGTPTYRAAWAEPPTAKLQLPNRARIRTHVAIAATTIHHTSSTLHEPVSILNSVVANGAKAGSVLAASGRLTIVRLVIWRVRAIVAPRRISCVARVTMKDGRPVRITNQPFVAPITRAKTDVAGHANAAGRGQTG